jgi:hypothetical protein
VLHIQHHYYPALLAMLLRKNAAEKSAESTKSTTFTAA